MRTAKLTDEKEIHFVCPKCIKGSMVRYQNGDANPEAKKKLYRCNKCGYTKKF